MIWRVDDDRMNVPKYGDDIVHLLSSMMIYVPR